MLQKHLSAGTGSRGNGIAAGKGEPAYLTTCEGARKEWCRLKPSLPTTADDLAWTHRQVDSV